MHSVPINIWQSLRICYCPSKCGSKNIPRLINAHRLHFIGKRTTLMLHRYPSANTHISLPKIFHSSIFFFRLQNICPGYLNYSSIFSSSQLDLDQSFPSQDFSPLILFHKSHGRISKTKKCCSVHKVTCFRHHFQIVFDLAGVKIRLIRLEFNQYRRFNFIEYCEHLIFYILKYLNSFKPGYCTYLKSFLLLCFHP